MKVTKADFDAWLEQNYDRVTVRQIPTPAALIEQYTDENGGVLATAAHPSGGGDSVYGVTDGS